MVAGHACDMISTAPGGYADQALGLTYQILPETDMLRQAGICAKTHTFAPDLYNTYICNNRKSIWS